MDVLAPGQLVITDCSFDGLKQPVFFLEAPAIISNSIFTNLEESMILINKFGIGVVTLSNNDITYNLKTIFAILLDDSVDPTNLIDI